jgi:hypothetical protein
MVTCSVGEEFTEIVNTNTLKIYVPNKVYLTDQVPGKPKAVQSSTIPVNQLNI